MTGTKREGIDAEGMAMLIRSRNEGRLRILYHGRNGWIFSDSRVGLDQVPVIAHDLPLAYFEVKTAEELNIY